MTDRTLRTADDLDTLDFAKVPGLVPVVAQDAEDGRVLMVALATREALSRSLESGRMHFWSRSRQALWQKGETSGNVLELVSLHADCDADTVLARVRPTGPACHTGEATCFGEGAGPATVASPGEGTVVGRAAGPTLGGVLEALSATVAARQEERPDGSYTVLLLDDENLRLKKLGEETTELVMSLAAGSRGSIAEEAADLLYHLLVALRGAGLDTVEVAAALQRRRR
jgi:phosphoribosyl-ATP pyrophosphohydrolase/phosphoribosyl-AMP cyclohydrolase